MAIDFDISGRDRPQISVIAPCGDLDITSGEKLIEVILAAQNPTVVVDLSGVEFMDSSGISSIVIASNRLEKRGFRLVLARPSPIVGRALEFVGLGDWVEEWDGPEHANDRRPQPGV